MDAIQPTAWLFMLAVWGMIIGATLYCFVKLLTSERKLDSGGADQAEEHVRPGPPETGAKE